MSLCEQFSNVVEHADVCGWVRARRAANWRLIDIDDLVDQFHTLDALMEAWRSFRAIDLLHKSAMQNVVDECRLP